VPSTITAAPANAFLNPSVDPAIVSNAGVLEYEITPGDLIEVSVYTDPEIAPVILQRVRVNSEGDVYLPMVKQIHLAGSRVEAAQAVVEQAFKGKFFRKPYVNLVVAEYASGVSVLGEVSRPGVYPLLGSNRILDLIAAAGGLSPNAGNVVTLIRKQDPSHPETLMLSHDPVRQMEAHIEIHQGDAFVVARAGVVYVLGEVMDPRGYIVQNDSDYAVTRLIARARGPSRTASLGKARIIRKSANGDLQEIPLPLDKIMASKAPDMQLQPEDIVYVPSTARTNLASRSVEAIFQMATGAALVGATR
jgi:polysaccharide export outer membrane protein